MSQEEQFNELDLWIRSNPLSEMATSNADSDWLPPLFENLDDNSMYPEPSPSHSDHSTSMDFNTWLQHNLSNNLETLQLPPVTQTVVSQVVETSDQPIRRRRRKASAGSSSSAPARTVPMWKRNLADPAITDHERKSIKKAQKCRQQRDRKAQNEAELNRKINQLEVKDKESNEKIMRLIQEKEESRNEIMRLHEVIEKLQLQAQLAAPIVAPIVIMQLV